MDTLDYWTPADALAFRCSVEQVGTLKPAAPVAPPGNPDSLRDDQREALLHAPRAFRALVRIMEAGESRAALEAAREILTRAYGPAVIPAPPAPPAPPDAPPLPEFPEWVEPSRLNYGRQAGAHITHNAPAGNHDG